ncbi:MAG: ABC transporter permease [Clostridia bacterium]|nr:ABC transporter permease [Clostridia bacterium]
MKRALCFAGRCVKEIVRDPLTLFFGLAFPLVLLLLMSLIQANIPVALFEINHLAPGVAVFGQSFITLFAALLISRDRSTALLARLFSTPLTASGFLLGYLLPLLPMALAQGAIVYTASLLLGLSLNVNVLLALLAGLAPALLYIALGLLFGTILSDKQVGGICGALLTNLSAWLSGVWFDVSLLGGGFGAVCRVLPFYHAVEGCRAALNGGAVWGHLAIVLAWAVGILILAVWCFRRKMKRG